MGKDNVKTRRESAKFWDLVILYWRFYGGFLYTGVSSLSIYTGVTSIHRCKLYTQVPALCTKVSALGSQVSALYTQVTALHTCQLSVQYKGVSSLYVNAL